MTQNVNAETIFGKCLAKTGIFERAGDGQGRFEISRRLGDELRRQGKLFEAKDWFTTALRVSEGLGTLRNRLQPKAITGLSAVVFALRDWQAAETIHRDYLRYAEGQLGSTDRSVLDSRCSLADALEAQGKDKEAESLRSEIISVLRRTMRDGRSIWPDTVDRIKYADLLSMTTSDKTNLQEAMHSLRDVEDETNRGPNTWMRQWWHGVLCKSRKSWGRTTRPFGMHASLWRRPEMTIWAFSTAHKTS